MNLGIVGAGTMGANHARVISRSQATLTIVVDQDLNSARELAGEYGAKASASVDDLEGCSGAIVATPTATHTKIAQTLLARGLPLLVEKPLSARLGDVEAIISQSRESDVPVTCGFVERFNPAIQTALELLDGPALHLIAVRHSPRASRMTGSVVHDVAIHDIDLSVMFCGRDVRQVNSIGWAPPNEEMEIVDASIRFGSGSLATISANRWTQRKIRTLSVATDTQLIEIDMLRQDITVYRHVSHEMVGGAGYRSETVVDIPFVRHTGEPIELQLQHFLGLISGKADPEEERRSLLAPHQVAQTIEERAKEAAR